MSICKCNHIANEKNLKKIIITFAILDYLALLYLISGIVMLKKTRKHLKIIRI